MASVYDIYERKNYRNTIPLPDSVSFEVAVRETQLFIQAQSDLTARAKDSVFKYRYQVEEYLRQHPAFRETSAPIQIYASAPEIVRYTDYSCRTADVAPMSVMSGAIADFVGRDLLGESPNLIVASGGDAFIQSQHPIHVRLYALGSPMHNQLIAKLPALKKPFGISTYVPSDKIHAITVISRSACLAGAFASDIGNRLAKGMSFSDVMDRADKYSDVGAIILIKGTKIFVAGELILKSNNGKE